MIKEFKILCVVDNIVISKFFGDDFDKKIKEIIDVCWISRKIVYFNGVDRNNWKYLFMIDKRNIF